ncbi:TetR/AcrR family transcriptional regulator [Lichenicola sp.]|uniref:TetR/AcrR family transcriptional regulator n=1 Tax=Lichenicola sp. TaxID=2804529 RepID=UPI003B00DB81
MGRHKQFDPDAALAAALDVFRRQGFEGASLTDLTNAMGIQRPSLYAAFGSKEELFQKALERYREQCPVFGASICAQTSARSVAERLLYGAADQQTDDANPPGCLITLGAVLCSDEHSSVRQLLADARQETQEALQSRFERARAEGELTIDADPASLARYLMAVVHGMAVMAASGASRAALRDVATFALRAWPTNAPSHVGMEAETSPA